MNYSNQIIEKINYKDIIIITGMWFLIITLTTVLHQKEFIYNTPLLKGVFNYLFTFTGRFIFLALTIFYIISLYDLPLRDLHINFNNFFQQLSQSTIILSVFFFFVLFFVNIPLSYNLNSSIFKPLYSITTPLILVRSLFPLLAIFIGSIIIAISEQLLISRILYSYISNRLNEFLGILLSSLCYPLILLDFTPLHIIIHSLVGFISIYLYRKSKSLILPSLFVGFYYALFIVYIYGWNFHNL